MPTEIVAGRYGQSTTCVYRASAGNPVSPFADCHRPRRGVLIPLLLVLRMPDPTFQQLSRLKRPSLGPSTTKPMSCRPAWGILRHAILRKPCPWEFRSRDHVPCVDRTPSNFRGLHLTPGRTRFSQPTDRLHGRHGKRRCLLGGAYVRPGCHSPGV